MKLTCDLCGGTLQMNAGGQGAVCTTCGLGYSMERLREKLGLQTPLVVTNEPIPQPGVKTAEQEDDTVYDVTEWKKLDGPALGPAYIPQQFVMQNNGRGIGDLSGWVQQGGIGLGDDVFINGDHSHPYRVYSINDHSAVNSVKAGTPADLFLVKCPRKVLKNAQIVVGVPKPVANAYNYPGTVRAYFADLLQRMFGTYEIRTDVPHHELRIPITFMLYWGGEPALAVFLIDSNDSRARYQVEKAERVFALEGISCTHFYENYRNDMPYVINRVRGALG